MNITSSRYLFYFIFALLIWSGRRLVGKSWCDMRPCTSQSLETFESKCDELLGTIKSAWTTPTRSLWSRLAEFFIVLVNNNQDVFFLNFHLDYCLFSPEYYILYIYVRVGSEKKFLGALKHATCLTCLIIILPWISCRKMDFNHVYSIFLKYVVSSFI